MPLETALLSYAAFANLAIANPRHRPAPPLCTALPLRLARYLGIALLLLSALLAILRFGPYQGPVAWLGLVSAAGIALVLLMSRWPRTALALWMPLALIGALLPLL